MRLRVELYPADLDATLNFYVHVLGFDCIRNERGAGDGYLLLQRDEVVVAASERADVADRSARRPPVGVELVLVVDDVGHELNRIRDRGWAIEEGLTSRSWGARDFRLLDPSGYYITITEPDQM